MRIFLDFVGLLIVLAMAWMMYWVTQTYGAEYTHTWVYRNFTLVAIVSAFVAAMPMVHVLQKIFAGDYLAYIARGTLQHYLFSMITVAFYTWLFVVIAAASEYNTPRDWFTSPYIVLPLIAFAAFVALVWGHAALANQEEEEEFRSRAQAQERAGPPSRPLTKEEIGHAREILKDGATRMRENGREA